jgi:hypothetical protein
VVKLILLFNVCNFSYRLVAKLEETAPSEVDTFKTNMSKVMKDLLGRFKDLQFFTGKKLFECYVLNFGITLHF